MESFKTRNRLVKTVTTCHLSCLENQFWISYAKTQFALLSKPFPVECLSKEYSVKATLVSFLKQQSKFHEYSKVMTCYTNMCERINNVSRPTYYKFTIVGDCSVGKTSMILRYKNKSFPTKDLLPRYVIQKVYFDANVAS